MISVHRVTLNKRVHALVSYDQKGRDIGLHKYQAVLWACTPGTGDDHQWTLSGVRGYVVGKESGRWITWHENKPAIYLGRTLKKAWVTLSLLADK